MPDLKIKIDDIPAGGLDLPLELTPEQAQSRFLGAEDDQIRVSAPLSVRVRLERSGKRVIVRGRMQTAICLPCSSCLEEFDQAVEDTIFLVFTPEGEIGDAGEEVKAEELDEEYYQGEEINLGPVIRECLLLGIPFNPKCKPDCLGLCPICGRNKNIDKCECSAPTGHPGLAKLKLIRDKLPAGK